MAKVLLLDLGQKESIGLKYLKHALDKKGISCEIIPFHDEIGKAFVYEKSQGYKVVDIKGGIKAAQEKILELSQKINESQFVGISFISQAEEARVKITVSRFIKEHFPQKILVGGGAGITSDAGRIFRAAKLDYALRGEAENSFPELINAVSNGEKEKIKNIQGIVFQKGRKLIETKPAQLTEKEVYELPFAYGRHSEDEVNVLTERGCPNACVFCTVPRKGKPAHINEETIIEGLKQLAKNPEIKSVHFANDQLFLDKQRAESFSGKLISTGLSKRFTFNGMATVESLIKNGVPDSKLISLMRRANFRSLQVGVESLNDNMIRELKGNRFTSLQAMKLVDKLNAKGIQTGTFLLAAGVDTTSKEFIENYYRSVVRALRKMNGIPPQITMIQAWGKTPLSEKAKREGVLYTKNGQVKSLERTSPKKPVFIFPKDPALRDFFIKQLKVRPDFRTEDIEKVIQFSAQTQGPTAPATQKLRKAQGKAIAWVDEYNRPKELLQKTIWYKECKRRFGKITNTNLLKLLNDRAFVIKMTNTVHNQLEQYNALTNRAKRQQGLARARTLQRGRKKFKFSLLTNPTIKTRK